MPTVCLGLDLPSLPLQANYIGLIFDFLKNKFAYKLAIQRFIPQYT